MQSSFSLLTLNYPSLSAREFLTLLQNKLRMKGLVIGPDFALGRGGEGNIPTLRKLGSEMGFSVTVIPPVKITAKSSAALPSAKPWPMVIWKKSAG